MSVQALGSASLDSETLRILITSLPDAVMIANRQGEIVAFNSSAQHLLGIFYGLAASEECIANSGVYLMDGETACPPQQLPILRALRGEIVEGEELVVRKPGDSKKHHIRSSAGPLRDELGQLNGAIVICQDITLEKRRQEEQISELQSKQAYLDSIGVAIYSIDIEGRCSYLNESASKMLGLSPQEVLGRNIHNLIHHSCNQKECNILEPLRTGKGTRSSNETLWRWGQRPFPAAFTAEPVVENGRLTGCITTLTDLTEQKRFEHSLLLLAEAGETLGSRLDYRQTLQGVADLTVRLMADQCLCDVLDGDRLKRVAWGVRRPELQKMVAQAVEWVPPEGSAHPIARAVATGEPILLANINEEMIRSIAVNEEHAGAFKTLQVDSILSVPIAAYGKLFGVFTLTRSKAFGREFDRKDIELAVELGRRAGVAIGHALSHDNVLESERRFRLLAESMPQIVWSCRRSGYCEYLNSQWTIFTGLNAEASMGWGWMEAIHPDDRMRARDLWAEIKEHDGSSSHRAEYRLRSAGGDYRRFRTTAAPVRDLPDGTAHWVGISTDIEDDKALEDKRLEQRAELIRSNSELENFASVVAHDLREPLRTVQSFSELLVRALPPDLQDETKELAGFINSGVARMDALIAGLLSYAQVGSASEETQAVDCDSVVATTLQQLSAVIESAGADITCSPLPKVQGYEVMLTQVFQNLISNALKYRSERKPKIQIGGRATESECVFYIRDNGPGISPENHQRIFGLFQRLHSRDVPGIGLGLANCAKIIERHGGRIWVESEPAKGATFFFAIPHRAPSSALQN